MADRSQSRTMIVSKTPEKSYDYNNLAYCSKLDSENLRVPGLPEAWVLIGDAIVLTLGPYGFNPDGCIALNAIQRRNAKTFTGDSISVSMFIPPENFNLALLSVELELANKDGDDVHVDAILFSKLIRKYLVNQVMTVGQRVLYDCCGVKYIFTVNQAVLVGKGRSNGIERGMISADTRVVFTAPLSSGIQVLNQREPTSSNIFQNKEVNLQPFDLERCRLNGIMECGPQHDHIYRRTVLLAEQVKVSEGSPLITCLLEGPSGSGKTAMAATVGIESDFPYVKFCSAGTMIGLSESTKCAQIVKVFEDAYKSPLSIIILDNIERLLGYVPNGPRFSDLISETLLVLLSQLPPKGKKLLVIGTTSQVNFLDSLGIRNAFTLTYHVPSLKTVDAKKVLQQLNVFSKRDLDSAAEALNDMPLKKLYMVVEMAAQGKDGGNAEAIYDGRKKINVSYFYDCLQDMVRR